MSRRPKIITEINASFILVSWDRNSWPIPTKYADIELAALIWSAETRLRLACFRRHRSEPRWRRGSTRRRTWWTDPDRPWLRGSRRSYRWRPGWSAAIRRSSSALGSEKKTTRRFKWQLRVTGKALRVPWGPLRGCAPDPRSSNRKRWPFRTGSRKRRWRWWWRTAWSMSHPSYSRRSTSWGNPLGIGGVFQNREPNSMRISILRTWNEAAPNAQQGHDGEGCGPQPDTQDKEQDLFFRQLSVQRTGDRTATLFIMLLATEFKND